MMTVHNYVRLRRTGRLQKAASKLCAKPPAQWRELVRLAALRLQASVSDTAVDAVASWIEQLVIWNEKIDLTAARDENELVDLCIADALMLQRDMTDGARVVDVGTGAGAPGLALAILRPDLALTLVEPLGKRVSFLRTVIGGLGLSAKVIQSTAQQLEPHLFDVAVSRATLAPESWLRLGIELVCNSGRIAVLYARNAPDSTDRLQRAQLYEYLWPFTKSVRKLQWYQVINANGGMLR